MKRAIAKFIRDSMANKVHYSEFNNAAMKSTFKSFQNVAQKVYKY